MFNNMLLPLDGSKLSEATFPLAREFTGRLGLKTTCLYVSTGKDDPMTAVHDAYVKAVAVKLGGEFRTTHKRAGFSPELVHSRSVAEAILNYSKEHNVDLILMATHGRSGLSRWMVGSIAMKVLQAAEVPVVLVRSHAPYNFDCWTGLKVIIPLDGSPLAEAVLPYVDSLAKKWGEGLQVILLGVCGAPVMPGDYTDEMRRVWQAGYGKQELTAEEKETQKYLDSVVQRLKDVSNLQATTHCFSGIPAEEIIRFAAEIPESMIAMSTHGRSGIGRWIYGSVAEKVLLGANSPILLVRSRETTG